MLIDILSNHPLPKVDADEFPITPCYEEGEHLDRIVLERFLGTVDRKNSDS